MFAESPSTGQPPELPSLGLMSLAVGISVANPYYAQSLLPSVEAAFGLQSGSVLLGPMATQLGMAAGFLLVLPLGDGTERRRMLTLLAGGMALACGAVVLSPTFAILVMSWFALGVVALIPSLLPPFLTALTPEHQRGRMLGIVFSGMFSGILLSRSVSGLLAQLWGWRSIYALSAVAMVVVALLFRSLLPVLPPANTESYWSLQRSSVKLWFAHARLRLSCLTQALLFGSFMALWSAVALHLGGPDVTPFAAPVPMRADGVIKPLSIAGGLPGAYAPGEPNAVCRRCTRFGAALPTPWPLARMRTVRCSGTRP
jgi:predicted MFS family arabinose efflux permease